MRALLIGLALLMSAGPAFADELGNDRTSRSDEAGQGSDGGIGNIGGDGDPENDFEPGDDYYKGWCCKGPNNDVDGDGDVDQADSDLRVEHGGDPIDPSDFGDPNPAYW